jgi:hypothetical protein
MSICLAMMCKNESAYIAEALRSVLPFIDRWSILDTGSTDDTVKIIRKELREVKGTLHQEKWQGWDKTRTRVIQLAKESGCDFIFILDADERVLCVPPETQNLDPDKAYWVTIKFGNSGMMYARPNLLSTKHNWHYVGVTHEYLTAAPDNPPQAQLPMVIETHPDRANKTPERCLEDAKLLADEFAKNPNDARTVFYLAQSYKDGGDPEKAIMFYQLRSQMGGWDEEVYISLLRIAQLKCHRRPFPEVAQAFVTAHQYRPQRAGETLGCFSDFCQWWADGTPFPEKDKLFVQAERYRPAAPVQQPPKLKLLIAIMSCEKDRWLHETQRQTWIADIPEGVDYKFFMGTGSPLASDEVILGCDDSYEGLCPKLKGICKWALEHGYTHIFKCDTDTCVWATRLLHVEWWRHHYVGGLNNWYASGGSGYTLDRQAMQWVVEDSTTCEWEDVYVGRVLKGHGVNLHADNRFQWEPDRAAADNNTVSLHLSHNWLKDAEPYQPRMMYAAYQA